MKHSYLSKISPVLLLFIPALVAFLIALLPTMKYHWPLGGDIFYHVHMAQLYLEQGLVLWDPLTSAPYGRPISYPPLFHLFLIPLGLFFGDFFTGARFLQPFLTMMIFFSFAVVAYKLYKSLLIGITAGFFIFFSICFQRFILSGPENLALIIFPWVIYFFHLSIENKSYKYASISGLMAGIITLTHSLSASCLLLVTAIYTLFLGFKNRDVFKYWTLFFILTFCIASVWWGPLLINYGFIFNPSADTPYFMSLISYIKFFGVIPLIFAAFGAYVMIKRKNNQDIFMLIMLCSLFILSNLNYLGLPILSNRILTFALLPMVIMAGVGVNYLLTVFDGKNISRKFFYVIISCVYLLSVFTGVSMLADFDKGILWLKATDSELDVAEWFQTNGDKTSVVASYNFRDSFIVAVSRQPVSMGGYGQGITNSLDIQKYVSGNVSKSDLAEDHVKYLVLPLGISAPPNTQLAYNNTDFKIYIFNNQGVNRSCDTY